MLRLLSILAFGVIVANYAQAAKLEEFQGSWVTTIEMQLPSRSSSTSPPRIVLVSRTRIDSGGNAISVASASIESKIRDNYEPLISYAVGEQAKWTLVGDRKVSVETVRCTFMQTDRLPDVGSIARLREILRDIVSETCKTTHEELEIISIAKNAIVLRQDDVSYEMKRADRDE